MSIKKLSQYYQYVFILTAVSAVYSISNVINFFSLVALCCLFISIYLRTFEFADELKEYSKAVFVWSMGCLIASLASDAISVGVHEWYKWFIKYFGLMFLPFAFRQKINVLKLSLALSFGIVTILSLMIVYRGMILHEQRVGGYFTSGPMVIGVFLGLFVSIMIICFFDKRVFGKWSYLLGVAALLVAVALLYNNTRGTQLSVAICALTIGIVHGTRSKKKFLIYVSAIALLGCFIFANPATRARWDIKNDGRVLIWQTSWQMFKDHPICGVGFKRFRYAYKEIYHGFQGGRTGNNIFFHAHNLFLNAMVEGGVVGLGTFTYFFVFALLYPYKLWNRYRDPYSLMMLIMTLELFINGMVETVIVHDQIMRTYWCLMGLLLALHLQCRKSVVPVKGVEQLK